MINKEQEQKWESARGSDLCTHCHHFLLIIPEIVLRVCTSEQLGRISDFPRLGGMLNPLLSSLIFLALLAIILAVIATALVKRIFRTR